MTREKSIEQMMWEANSISRDLRDRLEKTHSLGNDMCEMIWNSFIGPKLKSNGADKEDLQGERYRRIRSPS